MHASKLSYRELVALLAMMVGTVAFSVDGMLPALPQIATHLSPETPKRAQDGQRSDLEAQDDNRTEPRRFQDRLRPPNDRLA